jgi:hypothetical protein
MGNAVNNSFKNFSFERVFPFQERATRIYGQKKKVEVFVGETKASKDQCLSLSFTKVIF